jgi:hypothetical protein
LAKDQDSAALSGRFISPPDRRCQRLLSTNRRTAPENLALRESPCFSGLHAVLEPQSYDVLAYIGIESLDASGGRGGENTREPAKITHEPVAFLTRTDHFEEICTLLTSVISAARSASCHENPCGTSHSRSFPEGADLEAAQALVECRSNLGGWWVEPQDVTRGRIRA